MTDFYLTTAGEYKPLTQPRACIAAGRLADRSRDDYMLVNIDPPLVGYETAEQKVSQLLLASKWNGLSLFPPNQWPMPVYVMIILDKSILETHSLRAEQVRVIAWGTLHQTYEEAADVAQQFRE